MHAVVISKDFSSHHHDVVIIKAKVRAKRLLLIGERGDRGVRKDLKKLKPLMLNACL